MTEEEENKVIQTKEEERQVQLDILSEIIVEIARMERGW